GGVTLTGFAVAGVPGTQVPGATVTVTGGSITVEADGDYTFTPAAHWNGTFPVVTYTVADADGDTNSSTLTITVTPADDAIVDGDETLTVAEDSGSSTGNLLLNTTAPDGGAT